jgi:hypothetical protein
MGFEKKAIGPHRAHFSRERPHKSLMHQRIFVDVQFKKTRSTYLDRGLLLPNAGRRRFAPAGRKGRWALGCGDQSGNEISDCAARSEDEGRQFGGMTLIRPVE